MNELGEALRLVSKVYYRLNNDGDSYYDCLEYGIVPDFTGNNYPFDKEYKKLGQELDILLSSSKYDQAVSLILFHIMLSLSSESNIYNPETNKLVPLESVKGRKALADLDINSVFINYCGKNKEWLQESLRKDGVKITKSLSEQTKIELKCDTVRELYREKTGYNKHTVKVTLSTDNTILSKKFSKIQSQHKKSIKEVERKRTSLQKKRENDKKNY